MTKLIPRKGFISPFVLSVFFTLAMSLNATSSSVPVNQVGLALQLVTSSLELPVLVTHAGDSSGRLFIIEQRGRIRIVKEGALLPRPFLNIQSLVRCCGEQGLLGLAFHPQYEKNRFFYINYTDVNGDTIVARYSVSDDPDVADPQSAQRLLFIDQPYANHNGGHLAFGPDGFLYIGTGDGGLGGDPLNAGQDLQRLLGKILRIDVNAGSGYAIPPMNPFVGQPGRDEVWAYGLRNPWRFNFDRETGDLYIGDVGQGQWEEIDFQPADSVGGENYGWRIMEGLHCYNPASNCNQTGLVLPIHEYNHREGCSVTGGYVYRGEEVPELVGTYLFGDYCSGIMWGLRRNEAGVWKRITLLDTEFRRRLTSFGEDEARAVYVVDYDGTIYRITRGQ